MVHEKHEQIFRAGSKTYYFSSRFFPRAIRTDVYALYGFVRVADNLVDDQPVDPAQFHAFRKRYADAWHSNSPSGDEIIDSFIELQRRKGFDPAWTEAFLDSMEHDLAKTSCDTLEETLAYIYGSAEVVGLYMAKIMGLPDESHRAAAMLGRAMQYINFIRDIAEDNQLGRRYLPLGGTSLRSLAPEEAKSNVDEFKGFIRREIDRYRTWQAQAAEGYHLIPRRFRIPIMTAADMYCWTSMQIEQDPMIVFERRVKPHKFRILRKGLAHTLGVAFGC